MYHLLKADSGLLCTVHAQGKWSLRRAQHVIKGLNYRACCKVWDGITVILASSARLKVHSYVFVFGGKGRQKTHYMPMQSNAFTQ